MCAGSWCAMPTMRFETGSGDLLLRSSPAREAWIRDLARMLTVDTSFPAGTAPSPSRRGWDRAPRLCLPLLITGDRFMAASPSRAFGAAARDRRFWPSARSSSIAATSRRRISRCSCGARANHCVRRKRFRRLRRDRSHRPHRPGRRPALAALAARALRRARLFARRVPALGRLLELRHGLRPGGRAARDPARRPRAA